MASATRFAERVAAYSPVQGVRVRADEVNLAVRFDEGRPEFYIATFEEAVYVLHAFVKRPGKTAQHDVQLARDRYRALVNK